MVYVVYVTPNFIRKLVRVYTSTTELTLRLTAEIIFVPGWTTGT